MKYKSKERNFSSTHLYRQQQCNEYQEAMKKKDQLKKLAKAPFVIASTFNLEEKWKDARKEIHKTELEYNSYNMQHGVID